VAPGSQGSQGSQGPGPRPRAWRSPPAVPPRELAQVTLEDQDGVAVATVSGEVDMSSVNRVAAALTELSNLAIGLVIDLRSVEYLDSSGISLLHDLALRLRRRSQMLIIVCPPGSPPRRMLELTALDAQAVVLDDLEPAIEAVRAADEDGSVADGRT
jgi:anti-anti-sigma factor